MMTHELIHTAFPSMDDEQHWIEEGLSVYVEPIARAQNGLLSPEKIWSDMARDMPQGNPGASDRGLDQTHTWGRTYWGGAQFCLLADVMIRKETHNQKGLQEALRAIVAAGGTIDHDWPITKAFAVGDQATGTHVLTQLYEQMRNTPKPVDLNTLWKDLGVEQMPDGVRLNNNAPFANIRKAITLPPRQVEDQKKPGI
jgi:predicted metalloprotease with PDZ domain